MKNLKFHYMYRDGDNYKMHGEVVFKGYPTQRNEYLSILLDCLNDSNFIAEQVGIKDVFLWIDGKYKYDNDVDHCLHEFIDIDTTDEEPTDERTHEELLVAFQLAAKEGWKYFNPAERL